MDRFALSNYPVTHRFINADGYFQSGGGILDANMQAYCGNNPVNCADPNGEFWNIVIGAAVGGLISGGIEVVSQIMSGKSITDLDWGAVAIETVTGMATGALASCGVPPIVECAVNGAIGVANSVAHSIKNGENFETAATNAAIGGLSSIAISAIKPIGKSVTNGEHLKLGKVGTTVKKLSNSKVEYTNVVTTTAKTITKSTTTKVNAPKKQTQCRACGRPIGNQYAWQCSSPSYY